jgi:hypothetical protein
VISRTFSEQASRRVVYLSNRDPWFGEELWRTAVRVILPGDDPRRRGRRHDPLRARGEFFIEVE